MKRLIIASAIALSAAVSLAQNAAESIEVRVVNVDVVVRDRAGKPVTGLMKADFEIYENGQKREITNLYEVHASPGHAVPATTKAPAEPGLPPAAEPPVEIRPRNIVMFVDNYSLQPFRRDKVLQSLRKFIDEQLRPQDHVMLVLCTQQVKVITPFTNDRKAIEDGVASIKQVVGASSNRTSSLDQLKRLVAENIDAAKEGKFSWKDAYNQSLGLVDGFVEQDIFGARNTLNALGQVTAALAGLEGKNVVVFAGAHLPEHPGAELYLWLYNAFSPYMGGLNYGSETISGKTGSMQHYSIEEAAKQASANNVALYIIDAADSRDSVSAENNTAVDQVEKFTAFTSTAVAYQTLARISGGLALTNSDNFDSAFQTLAADLNSYYSLGFKPSSTTGNAAQKIVVKMKNPEYRFRARETYIAKAPVAQDEMSTRVIANIYTMDPRNSWEVHLKPGTPEKEGAEYRVPFELSFAPTITLLPKDADLVGNFAVYVVVGNGSGTSKVIKNVHAVKVPTDAEDDFREKPMTYKAVILMTPGENTLSVAIVDQASNNAGFARAKVVVP
ncbi:MAG TPA: VWA domain-containing protein [Thermoanaerobaculia bacterium]|nr:VWA domain-containing protein [Thermoanaerobaculia bacterium]